MHEKKLRNSSCGRLIVPEHTRITSSAANTLQYCFSRQGLSKGKLQGMDWPMAVGRWSSIASGEAHLHPWGARQCLHFE